jgi:hypothetical protein
MIKAACAEEKKVVSFNDSDKTNQKIPTASVQKLL